MDTEDRATQAALQDGEELTNMANSRGWAIARGILTAKILDLQNISNIDETSIENVVIDIKARKASALILFEFLNAVEGRVEQHANNKNMLSPQESPDDFVDRK